MSTEPLAEVTPEKVRDDVEVVLILMAPDRDASVFVTACVEMSGQSAEQQARSRLSGSYDGEYNRCAALVRVRVPRSLFRERWKKAES